MSKRTGTKRLAAFVGTLALSLTIGVNGQTCPVSIQTGTADQQFDSIFTQDGPGTGLETGGTPGWTGADSTYSIELPNGDSAFFFSDSYIAESPAFAGDGTVTTSASGLRTRLSNCGAPICDPPTNLYHSHNSVVVRNNLTGALNTLTGPPDLVNGYASSYFAPAGAAASGHFYWMGDSAVVQTDALGTKKLWVFLLEFDSSWSYFGSAIAQLSLPSMSIETIQPLLNPPTSSSINWGSALLLEGSYGAYTLNIYGMKTTGSQKRPYVARVSTAGNLLDVANMANWTAWDGTGWSINTLSAAPIIVNSGDPNNVSDSISDEYSV